MVKTMYRSTLRLRIVPIQFSIALPFVPFLTQIKHIFYLTPCNHTLTYLVFSTTSNSIVAAHWSISSAHWSISSTLPTRLHAWTCRTMWKTICRSSYKNLGAPMIQRLRRTHNYVPRWFDTLCCDWIPSACFSFVTSYFRWPPST